MNYKKKLRPGLAVELVVAEGSYAGKYRSRIDEVGERLVSVEAPFIERQVIPLSEGTVVEITFWDEISAYSFESAIMQRIAVPVPLFVLELPDEVRKVQRRNYVRVPAFFPITYRSVNRQGLGEVKKADMQDLSGGGMRFRTKDAVEYNGIIYASLQLPTGELHTPARVRRVDKTDDEKAYIVSVEFYEISERERDKIIRCVFDIQRTMRKKGLI